MRIEKPTLHLLEVTLLIVVIIISVSSQVFATGESDRPEQTDTQPMDHSHHMAMLQSAHNSYKRSTQHYELPNTLLLRDDGAQVSLESEINPGRPVMLNFIFTSCTTICPVMSAGFSKTQERLNNTANAPLFISISIDPEYDTLERLHHYGKSHRSADNWHFLTGESTQIIALQKAFDVYRGNKMNHAPVTFLRLSDKSDWIRLDGLVSAEELVDEYQHLLTQ